MSTQRTSLRTSRRLVLAAGVLGATVAGIALPPFIGSAVAADPACVKYASPSGSDSATGSSSAPFRTATRLASSLTAGQVGCLATGSYTGDVSVTADGATLRSTPGQRATLYVNTLSVPRGADDVTISDLNIVGNSSALTTRLSGDRFTFTRNDITNNNSGRDQYGSCVMVADSSVTTVGGVISLNRIHECGPIGTNFGHGIYTQNVSGLSIVDNVIRGVGSYAVQLYPKAYGVSVKHNVIDGGLGSIRGGIVIDGEGNNHRVEQNVITYAQTGAVQARVGSGHASVNNCYWSNPSNASGNITVSGDITSDPGFADRSGGDYRLRAGSACLAKVGYDTAAKVAAAMSGQTAPAPSPSTSASPAPTTSPSAPASPAPSPTATSSTAPSTAPSAAPSVAIVSPTHDLRVRDDLHVVVEASDDGEVVRVELFIDGRLVGVETSAPYDQWVGVHDLTRGSHTLTAVAVDDDGNRTRDAVRFRKR